MTRVSLVILVVCVALGCGGTDDDGSPAPVCADGVPSALGFTRYTVDDRAAGPAFVAEGDLDGDGRLDLVVGQLGPVAIEDGVVTLSPARVSLYLQGDSVGCWSKRELMEEESAYRFPNQPTLADVDDDGDLDVIQPFGFFVCQFDPATGPCGALAWLENDGDAGFTRHDIVPTGADRFYHRALLADLDGDGLDDVVTVGEDMTGGEVQWFRGVEGPERFSPEPVVIGRGLGSLPSLGDIDGDGDLDLASGEFFGTERSFAWLEQVSAPGASAPAGEWVDHTIDDASGPAIQLSLVPDLFGDGRLRALGSNHTNTRSHAEDAQSGLFVYEVPRDPRRPWPRRMLTRGIASRPNDGFSVSHAPGVFGWGDADGDGDVDIALSGDGDPRTFLLEQTAPGDFTQHVLEEDNGQAGGGHVVDLDGDGRAELVFTGYERDSVFVYAR